jgi:cobalt-zinc-cadmium efflux system protein
MALIADALHNATDIVGLFIAWGAMLISKSASSERFTYGLRSSTILAAFINSVFIFVMVGGVTWEALARFGEHSQISLDIVMYVAAFGVLINGITAFLLYKGSHKDINIKGAFLHMIADAGISAGVILSSVLILLTGWLWLDPLVSILIVFLVIVSSWGLFKESIKLILNAVPESINIREVKNYLLKQKGVHEVHDLHIWALSSTEVALSAHLVVAKPKDDLLHKVSEEMKELFNITHSTIQFESKSNRACKTSC